MTVFGANHLPQAKFARSARTVRGPNPELPH